MKPTIGWILGSLVAALIVVPPAIHYRSTFAHHKRLREVTPGKFYRSGQLTAEGFRDAVARHGIRTVINLQGEFPDPNVHESFWVTATIPESEMCAKLGVRYVFVDANGLRSDRNNPEAIPDSVADYVKLLDDRSIYPVLLHCRAGLHRTGLFTAIYRMEFEGWSHSRAAAEVMANGFNVKLGKEDCTAANDYVKQYLLNYRPRRIQVAAAE